MSSIQLAKGQFPPQTEVELRLNARLNITAYTAQRKVNVLLLDEVGNLLFTRDPYLVMAERLLWRVPIEVALPTTGPLGEVGVLDVDAQSGEILYTEKLLDQIAEQANALAGRAVSAAA